VLVVDDQPDACEVLKAILEERGAEVTAVSSVGDAMRTLVGWAPNVLVSDLAMPDEDGYALIRRVRALDHELGRIPAVAVTACAGAEHRTRTSAAGYQLHLVKPVETNVLVAAIARLTEAGAGRHG
jgi:CheY-like chemotaxis protein